MWADSSQWILNSQMLVFKNSKSKSTNQNLAKTNSKSQSQIRKIELKYRQTIGFFKWQKPLLTLNFHFQFTSNVKLHFQLTASPTPSERSSSSWWTSSARAEAPSPSSRPSSSGSPSAWARSRARWSTVTAAGWWQSSGRSSRHSGSRSAPPPPTSSSYTWQSGLSQVGDANVYQRMKRTKKCLKLWDVTPSLNLKGCLLKLKIRHVFLLARQPFYFCVELFSLELVFLRYLVWLYTFEANNSHSGQQLR